METYRQKGRSVPACRNAGPLLRNHDVIFEVKRGERESLVLGRLREVSHVVLAELVPPWT